MPVLLKQSTSIEIHIGPFLDDTDGKTAETGLTITQADVRLSKYTTGTPNFAQKGEATALSHDENGWYTCKLNTTDTNTLGDLIVAIHESGALPVHRVFKVVTANEFNSARGTDYLDVTVSSITDKTGYSLSAAGIDDIWDEVQETGTIAPTARQIMRLIISYVGAKTSNATTRPAWRDVNDTKTRIIHDSDSKGNRSAVTLDMD